MNMMYASYLRYKHKDGRKFYFARLHRNMEGRTLRKKHTRARDAIDYGRAVAERWNRINDLTS